jgi:hypothetical protein
VAEGARLESVYTGNRIEGSNPSLSASVKISDHLRLLVTRAPPRSDPAFASRFVLSTPILGEIVVSSPQTVA